VKGLGIRIRGRGEGREVSLNEVEGYEAEDEECIKQFALGGTRRLSIRTVTILPSWTLSHTTLELSTTNFYSNINTLYVVMYPYALEIIHLF
jgi:hypothetical protein